MTQLVIFYYTKETSTFHIAVSIIIVYHIKYTYYLVYVAVFGFISPIAMDMSI